MRQLALRESCKNNCVGTGGAAVPSFFFQAEDGIRDDLVTGVQTCALPILPSRGFSRERGAATSTGFSDLGFSYRGAIGTRSLRMHSRRRADRGSAGKPETRHVLVNCPQVLTLQRYVQSHGFKRDSGGSDTR